MMDLPNNLQSLPAEQFAIVLYVLAGLIVILVVMLLLGKLARNRLIRKMDQSATQQSVLQERLDGMNVGVVLADNNLQVTYANRTGAYLLGQKAETIAGKSLVDLLPEACHTMIEQAGSASRELSVQCLLPARQREYRIRLNANLADTAQAKAMLVLEDVHHYQHQLNQAAALDAHIQNLFDDHKVGLASLDVAQRSLHINSTLATWLQLEEQVLGVAELINLTNEGDQLMLERAIEQLGEGERLDLSISLKGADNTLIPVTVRGALASHTSESKAPLAHITLLDRREVIVANKQLESAKKRLTSLMSTATQPVYVLDHDLKVVDCNRGFATLFATDLMRIKGKHIDELALFDDAFKALHHNVDSMMAKRHTLTTTRADGSTLALNVVMQALTDEGKRSGILAVIEDITALTALEQDVTVARQRLSMFIDHSPMGVALFNGDDTITEVNQTLCKQLGVSSNDLTEQSFYQLFTSADDAGKLSKKLHRHDQVNEFAARLKGGNNKAIASTIYASKISEIPQEYVCWVGGREEQEYLNSRFDRLLKYASVPVAMLSDKGFTHLNSAACAFFGVTDEEELLGLSLGADVLNEKDANFDLLAQKLDAVSTQGQVITLNWQHKYKHQTLPCELTLIPILRDAKLQSIICIWVDMRAIEQAKAARSEAVKLREAAEREVEEKQQLLATSQSKLAQQQQTLAQTEQTLAQTEQRLQDAEVTLSEKLDTISDLQQAHKDISEHLNSLKADYAQNRQMLQESQQANAALEEQLEQSSMKVGRLEKQRNQIADALQYSERQYRDSQAQLEQSQKETQRLKQQKAEQQQAVEQYLAQISNLQADIADKDTQLGDVSGQIATLQSQLTSSDEATNKLREQLVNQRKASEQAERERRELELAFRQVQSEAEGKARRIDHLQHEMQMLEEMSQQQKGDMEAHASQLAKELEAKQSQLKATEGALSEIKLQAEKDKQEKEQQQQRLMQLQQELAEVERRTQEQQARIAEADANWKAQQEALQQALQAKQAELQQTEQILSEAKQQTQAEKEEKARQQAIFAKLKEELSAMEKKAAEQQQAVQQSESKWQSEQQALAQELAAKQAKLAAAESELDNRQKQMDAEKLERESQQNKLSQLKSELADVAQRAAKQKEMMLGSDEQWRKHHEEIEAQKQQLQQALKEAQAQNSAMQNKLQSSMTDLASAEERVTKTQTEEQRLQGDLNQAREKAEQLQARLKQQEAQEAKLQAQVKEQQSALQSSQSSIKQLEAQQRALTQKLEAVQKDYAETQKSLTLQNSSQTELSAQLSSLEGELAERKSQLENSEKALEQAQCKLKESENKLAQQEKALVEAQKVELQQAQAKAEADTDAPQRREKPAFANLPMPPDPNVWFDLLPYLQSNQQVSSLASSLTSLMDKLGSAMDTMENAIMEDNNRAILLATRELIQVIGTIKSAPLNDMESRLASDCDHGNIDNISIFWPIAKQNLQRTLRVIYSHLHDDER